MAKKAVSDYYRATQGFSITLDDGQQVWVKEGELVHKDHELIKRAKDLFVPAENFGRFDVEQATAAPGEKRGEEPARQLPNKPAAK
jgi:hypothetical protein